MGAVSRAHDRELDEIVALKVLRLDLSSQSGFLSRLRREVKLARLVTHRDAARTYDIGERFLTMELLEGPSLGARLGRGRLDIAEAVALQIPVEELVEGAWAVVAEGLAVRGDRRGAGVPRPHRLRGWTVACTRDPAGCDERPERLTPAFSTSAPRSAASDDDPDASSPSSAR